MNREEAINLIKQYVKNKNSIKHMMATEAIMRDLAEKFNEDKERWGLAGLLHDIDMEIVDYASNPEKHGIKGAEILKEKGIDEEIIETVKAHNPENGKKSETLMEKSIFCADPLTGLIVAGVLVLPSKKISELTAESILKRFKEKAFARGANRETIARCSEIGIELEEFIGIGLKAMKKISNKLEL